MKRKIIFLLILFLLSGVSGFCAFAADEIPKITYDLCSVNTGWNGTSANGQAILLPDGRYATAFRAALSEQSGSAQLGVRYQVNLSGIGWLHEAEGGRKTGFSGGIAPIEAIRISLYNSDASKYDVYYSVYQNQAWTAWTKNGETAGTEGKGLQVEGVRARIVPAGSAAPSEHIVDPDAPMVALTFDDGPRAQTTARVLDALEAAGGRATFFMVGKNAAKAENAAVIQRMTEMGCALGNHTYDHVDLKKTAEADAKKQIQKTSDAVKAAGGSPTTLLRPPYGSTDAQTKKIAGALGYPVILWNVDTLDWKTKNTANTVKTILDNVQDGDIILMHDIYEQTAEAAEQVIPELVRRGYQLVTVPEMAAARGISLAPGSAYGKIKANR